jgi:hypothetical protein
MGIKKSAGLVSGMFILAVIATITTACGGSTPTAAKTVPTVTLTLPAPSASQKEELKGLGFENPRPSSTPNGLFAWEAELSSCTFELSNLQNAWTAMIALPNGKDIVVIVEASKAKISTINELQYCFKPGSSAPSATPPVPQHSQPA